MTSDFRGAPATKALLAVCVTLTVIGASSRGVFAVSDRSSILSRGEVWRLFTSLLPSDSIAEGLLSWFLLYRFRVLERHMGTAKFTAFVLLAIAWAALANAAFVAAPFWDSGVASGPYVLIFALFVYFFSAWCQRRRRTCELTAPSLQERCQSCIPITLRWLVCASQTSRGSTCSAYKCVLKSSSWSQVCSPPTHRHPRAAALQQWAPFHWARARRCRIRPAVHVRRAAHRVIAPGKRRGAEAGCGCAAETPPPSPAYPTVPPRRPDFGPRADALCAHRPAPARHPPCTCAAGCTARAHSAAPPGWAAARCRRHSGGSSSGSGRGGPAPAAAAHARA